MINTTSTRERRDWTLIIFIIPIGILLMLIAGKVAFRLVPAWSINAGMESHLDPNNLPKQQNIPLQPIMPAILTPMSWFETFLTPGAGSDDQVIFPPFVVFEPTGTSEATLPPPTVATEPSPTAPTATSPTASPPPATGTSTPPVNDKTPTPPTSKPPTDTPPTSTSPTGTPPTATPPTATPPTATPPTATPVPVTSTPSGTVVTIPPTPAGFNTGLPDDSIYTLAANSFLVIDLGANPTQQLIVNGTSDTNYDLVYYEWQNIDGQVYMDRVIIGISQAASGSPYYAVFNWGNGEPDLNSNVAAGSGSEEDNQWVDQTITPLYGPLQTGITINVDAAPSHPPTGAYRYIIVQSPDIFSGGGLEIDSIQVVEVTNPSAPAMLPLSAQEISPAVEGSSQPVEEAPVAPADNGSSSPAEEPPIPPADSGSSPPAEEPQAPPVDEGSNQPAEGVPVEPTP